MTDNEINLNELEALLKDEYLKDLFTKKREIDIIGSRFVGFGKFRQRVYREFTPVMKATIKYFETRDLPFIDKTRFWKWFRNTSIMKKTALPKNILPSDERMMEEQWDTIIFNILHGHMGVFLWFYAAPGWIAPKLENLVNLPSGPGFDELNFVLAMILGSIASSVTINFFASLARIGIHTKDFQRYAKRNDLQFIDVKKIAENCKKIRKIL